MYLRVNMLQQLRIVLYLVVFRCVFLLFFFFWWYEGVDRGNSNCENTVYQTLKWMDSLKTFIHALPIARAAPLAYARAHGRCSAP